MGHTCHLLVGQGDTISNVQIVRAEKVPIAFIRERVQQICKTYQVIGGMVDKHPESQIAKDLWDITAHRIVPAEYRGTVEINTKLVVGTDNDVEYVQVDRTVLLDEAARAIRSKGVEFTGYGPHQSEIKEHFRNMVREETPEEPAIWKKLNPNDHFFHALGFLLTSMKLRGYTDARYGSSQSLLGFMVADMPGNLSSLIGGPNVKRENKWPQTLFQS